MDQPLGPVTFEGHSAWRLVDQDGVLVATAGGDQVWVVDDLPGEVAAELERCWSNDPPTQEELSAHALRAVEQLRALGAIRPGGLPAGPTIRVGLIWCGDEVPRFASHLGLLLDDGLVPAIEADLAVVCRTTMTLAEMAERLQEPGVTIPHLLVDLASQHTVALGPFVVPGFSACARCLTGRVSRRWGDPPTPRAPGATRPAVAALAAGWVAAAVGAIADQRYHLIDTTQSFNPVTGEASSSPVLRWAGCPYCARAVTTGRVQLPWT